MDPREMDALLDVLEYDALAACDDEDPGYWTWRRPLILVDMPLHRVRKYVRLWKGLDGPLV